MKTSALQSSPTVRMPRLGSAVRIATATGPRVVTPIAADEALLWTGLAAADLARPGHPVQPTALQGEVVLRDGRRLPLDAAGLVPCVRQGRLALAIVRRGIDWRSQAPGGRLELGFRT